ncbi:MAG: PEP-CTERM sorting domain-containing protein [Pirellulales bacterium]
MTLSKLCFLAFLAAISVGSALKKSASFAAPLFGATVIVDTDGEVVATFRGHSAGYTNELYLDSPDNALGLLFTNQTTPVGAQVNLGSFTAGTELLFRMNVMEDGSNFFTGPADRNPDGIIHALVDEEQFADETYVAFEDILGGGDFNYNDLTFSLTNTRADGIVPEPATCLLSGLGGVLFVLGRRKWD